MPAFTAARSATKRASSAGSPARRSGPPSRLGEQEPGLLERLADDGDPVGQPAAGEAEQRAGLGVGATGADGLGLGPAVERVDRTAGEDVGAADEVGAQVAPDHQHLERSVAAGTSERRARA